MSDFFLPQSPQPFTETGSSLISESSQLVSDRSQFAGSINVGNVDANLRQISAIESRWRSPELPFEVKMDLAMIPDMRPEMLSSFLNGIDDDLNQPDEDPQITRIRTEYQQDPARQRTPLQDVQVAILGAANTLPPERPDADAVRRFKQRAVLDGYMSVDQAQSIDNRWSPELLPILNQMGYDDLAKNYSGERPFAVSTGSLMRTINDWTSPSGLLSALTSFGLAPNPTQITREFQTWGDKFRKIPQSKSIVEFGRNLVDAFTGPIDDIQLPIMNWGLIIGGFFFTGGTGSAAVAAANAARAANTASRFTRLMQTAGRVMAPQSIAEMKTAGFISQRLMNAGQGTLRYGAGNAMYRWRQFEAVARTKQIVGTGMRYGFVSQAQRELAAPVDPSDPNSQTWSGLNYNPLSLDDIPAVRNASEWLGNTGFEGLGASSDSFGTRLAGAGATALIELGLAPLNIFKPGTFLRSGAANPAEAVGLLNRIGSSSVGGRFGLGSVPGRAVVGGLVGTGAGFVLSEDGENTLTGTLLGAASAGLLPLTPVSRFASSQVGGAVIAGGIGGTGVAIWETARNEDKSFFDPDTMFTGIAVGAGVAGASLLLSTSPMAWLPNPGKMVGHAINSLNRLNYEQIANDQNIIASLVRGFRQRIELAGDTELLERFNAAARGANITDPGSGLEALAVALNLDGPETAKQAATWISAANGADYISNFIAGSGPSDANFNVRKFIYNSLRRVEIDDPAEIRSYFINNLETARANSKNPESYDAAIDYYRNLTDEELVERVQRLNESADEFLASLVMLSSADAADGLQLIRQVDEAMGARAASAFGEIPVEQIDMGPLAFTGEASQIRSASSPASHFEEFLISDRFNAFGDWNGFIEATATVGSLENQRIFDNIFLKPWTDSRGRVRLVSRSGSALSAADQEEVLRRLDDVDEAVDPMLAELGIEYDPLLDAPTGNAAAVAGADDANPDAVADFNIDEVNDALVETVVERVRAGSIDPTQLDRIAMRGISDGRVTVARADTLVKNDYDVEIDQLSDLYRTLKLVQDPDVRTAIASIDSGEAYRLLESGQDLASRSPRFFEMTEDELGELMKTRLAPAADADAAVKPKRAYSEDLEKRLIQMHEFVTHHQLQAGDNVEAYVMRAVKESLDDQEKWLRFKLPEVALGADNATALPPLYGVRKRIAQLQQRKKFIASEVDVDAMISYLQRRDGAAYANGVRDEVERLYSQGYKLVFGVDYLMPEEILARHPDFFRDVTVRHMNHATLGNFFGRRMPSVARAAEERRNRLILRTKLAEFDIRSPNAPDGIWDPNDDEITGQLAAIYRHLQNRKDEIAATQDNYHATQRIVRPAIAYRSALAPIIPADLRWDKAATIAQFEAWGWGKERARAMYAAASEMRSTDFEELGLSAFENRWRQRNELVQFLKFLRGDTSGNLLGRESVGLGVGAAIGYEQAEGEGGLEQLRSAAVGGAIGLGATIPARLVPDQVYARGIRAAYGRKGFALYDRYARWRDLLRFGLSPLFDLSRYTEGFMLGQTGAPTGADGRLVSMPLDMSPTGVRRRLKKSLQQSTPGATAEDARLLFDDYRSKFREMSLEDFNPDAPESTMRWMQQIGVLGFNLTDWQSGAFIELVEGGMEMRAAYEAAKNMFTYGVTGRSAAEMSANFVFFPFSFQKKAYTSLAKFMQDDLTRSIFITDAFMLYQALNEQYDLDEYWREYVPFMQQLSRLNLFAYGLSPGRLGGINAQLFETIGRGALQFGEDVVSGDPERSATSVVGDMANAGESISMFIPWMGQIKTEEDSLEIQRLMRSLAPVFNDINWMYRNLQDTGRIFLEGGRQFQQVYNGYEEWNAFRRDLEQVLQEGGYSWWHLHRVPALQPLSVEYYRKRAELSEKYPQWSRSRQESILNAQMVDVERQHHRARYLSGSNDPQSVLFMEFEMEVERVAEVLARQGVDVGGNDGWLDAPIDAIDYLKQLAADMLERDERFMSVWEKFYMREFGPIATRI